MIESGDPPGRGGHVPRPIRVPLSARYWCIMRASLHITALTALTLIASSALAIAAEVARAHRRLDAGRGESDRR
jgi:hypothetical protein